MTEPAMTEPASDSITVQATMAPDDYNRYFAVMRRRETSVKNTACYAGALFAAIPVALLCRTIAQHLVRAPEDAELIGKSSLAAFLLGAMAIVLAGFIARHLTIRRHVGQTLNAFAPKTVVFDATGVTMTGMASEARWRWPAISRLTTENGLMLVWIAGSSALAIPDRGFASPDDRAAAIAYVRARLSEAAAGAPSPAA